MISLFGLLCKQDNVIWSNFPAVVYVGESFKLITIGNFLSKLVAFLGQVMVKSNFSLPDDMKFGDAQIIAICAYSFMFILGLTLNSLSLLTMVQEWRTRRSRTRMNLLMINLAVADLMVLKSS